MGFGIGRGGLLTVLLGLFIYAIIGAGYVLLYATAVVCVLLKYAYLGARYLYRQHKRGKEMHEGVQWNLPNTNVDELPMPPTSPVEYRDNDWS